jgi:hypothetical protein
VTKADELLRGVDFAIAGDWDAAHELAAIRGSLEP